MSQELRSCRRANCERIFGPEETNGAVRRHELKHIDPNSNRCLEDDCTYTTLKPNTLLMHIKAHGIHTCPSTTCDYYTRDAELFASHVSTHYPFICTYHGCSTPFTTEKRRAEHEDQTHGNDVVWMHTSRCEKLGLRNGRCKICLFQFTEEYSDAAVQRHQDQHDNNGCFPCREEQCLESLGRRKNLTVHLKLQHHIYDCSLVTCGKTFSTNAELDEHIKTHSPFLCPYTGCGVERRISAMDSDAADATTKKPRKARGKTILSNTLSGSIPSQVKKENNNMLALTASSQPLFEQGGEYFFDVIDSRDPIKECGPESISSAPISCRHTSIVVRSELLDASQEHKNGTEAISPSRSLTQDPVRRRASGWDFVKPLSTRQQRIHQTCEYPGAQARSESSTSTPESYGQASTVVKSELLDASQEHKNGTEAISPSRSLTRDTDVIRSREQEELDECTKCHRRFTVTDSMSTIQRHLDSHERSRRRFICREQDCGSEFFLYENMRRHYIEDHSMVLCTERTCDALFSSLQDLDVHLQSPLHHPCRYQPCPSIYTKSGARNYHEKLVHGEIWHDPSPDDVYESIVNGQCPADDCSTTFDIKTARTDSMRAHLLQHESSRPTWTCVREGHQPKAYTNRLSFELHLRSEHDVYICTWEDCNMVFSNLDERLQHDATHFKVPCEVTNCMRWFHRAYDRDRHAYSYHHNNRSDIPPVEPLEGYDGAFIITVGYASASGDDGKLDLERNVIYFGNEATLDRGRIMMQGEIATPVAFLDQPALFTKQQVSDYIRLTMNGYVVGSPTKDARCRNCSVARVWRAFGLQVTPTLHNPVLYFNHRSLCSLCFLKERRGRIETTLRSHFKIAPDADLILAIISKLNANHVWPTFLGLRYCAKCHDVLNLQNTHFTLGTSTNIPISVPGYCDPCSYLVCEETRINDPLQQLATWIVRHNNDFNSHRMTAGTVWTLVVQGYNTIPAQYSEWEEIQLRLLVSSSVPRCFYTNQELSMHPHTCATTKLSFDRLVFDHQGKSLPYEDQNQVIVTASLFINSFMHRLTLQQRVDRLEQLRLAPTDGSFDAADAAFGKVELYDDIMERKRGWTPSLDKAWETFASRARSRGRLEMNKYEYRYLLECGSVSMVTGLPFGRDGRHIDRVFNSDAYSMKNCIVIEGSLNLGKAYMQAFQSSDGFQGSKGRYAIDTLRDELGRIDQLSRPYRSNYVARLVEMGRQPHIWKKGMKTQPILTH
ncbi:hypothetical protein BKA57DRAFT_533907 [Linnemannia elongata]|nr:hypothetical protein BKA57DRAFT_533907 [Linnemannia elongata]